MKTHLILAVLATLAYHVTGAPSHNARHPSIDALTLTYPAPPAHPANEGRPPVPPRPHSIRRLRSCRSDRECGEGFSCVNGKCDIDMEVHRYAAACMVNDKNGAVIKERKCQNKCGTDGREIVYEGKKLTAYYCEPPHSKDDLEDTIERLAALIDKRHGKGKLQKGGSYGNRPYGGTGHGGSYYDNWQYGGDGYGTGPYGNKPYGSDGGFYDNWPYGSQGYGGSYYDNWQYSNNGHGTGSYDNWQYGNDGYGTGSFGNWQYGNGGYGTGSYGNWQYGNDGYGTGSYGNWQYGNGGYGTGSYGNRPSSSESEGGDSSDWWDFWPFDKDGGSSEVSRHDNHEDVKNMPGDRPLPGGHPNHPGKPHNPGP